MSKNFFFTIISSWTILFIVGLFVGEMMNDLDKKEDVENYIETRTSIDLAPDRDSSVKLINNLKPLIRKTTFDAGRYYYTYIENSNERPHRIPNINYNTTNYKKRIVFDEFDPLLGIGSSLTGFIFTKNTINTISTSTLKEKAIAITIILSGFILGYKMTSNPNFDSDSPMAQSVLNDNLFWESVILHKNPLSQLRFKYSETPSLKQVKK